MNKKIIKGKWWNIEKKIKNTLTAKYNKIKDFKMDKKGYFLIKLDPKNKNIIVGYCIIDKDKHILITEIIGKKSNYYLKYNYKK